MKQQLRFSIGQMLLTLVFGLFFNLSWGQGSETFANMPANNGSYSQRNWNGDNGAAWSAGDARTDQTITSRAITVRSGVLQFGLTSTQVADGLGNLTLKAKAPFGSDVGSLQLVVNGVNVGAPKSVSGSSVSTIEWADVNVSPVNSIEIRQGASSSRITMDDVSWTSYSSTSPQLSADISSLYFTSTNVSTVSASQTITVNGANITGNITATAPANFQVSLNNTTWANSVEITPVTGSITDIPVYVRFSPIVAGTLSGNVSFSGGGLASATIVAVEGVAVIPAPIAQIASNVTATDFTANWNAVPGAESYVIDVYSREEGNSATDLFMSEYIEGSGNNKYIEIFNGTGQAVDLSDYEIRLFANGASSAGNTEALSGVLGNGEVIVFRHSSANISGTTSFPTSSTTNFNGDDAIGLYKNSTSSYVDIFGVIGNDPGSRWSAGSISTLDQTLVRKSSVMSGVTVNPSGTGESGFTTLGTEWDSFSIDNVDNLGSHEFDGGSSTIYLVQNQNVGNVLTYNVSNLQPNTTYYYVVRAVVGGSTSANSNEIEVEGTVTATTWNGTSWSNGAPTASIDAIIEGNYSTASGLSAAKSLTVSSGVFTVASGTTLTIENAITNNSGATNFVVESGANLIQTENVANVGAVTVSRNSAPIVRLDHTLWSSPVANQNLFAFSPATLTNRFYTYETATDNYINTGLNAASVFEGGKGYGVRAPNNFQTTPAAEWTGNFVGIANNGNVTVPVSNVGNGFNLVGNPYPSAMSASAVVGGNSNIGGTLYFYAHSLAMDANGQFPAGTNYALWNASGSTSATNSGIVPNGTIQVGQGFIVKATTAGNVTFNNTMRSNNVANQFFRVANNEVEKHRIWLNLSNNEGAFNQMLVAYVEGASNEVDRDFDGEAFGNTGSFIASKLNNKNYTIQGRALPFVDEDVVAMNFHAATAGNFTIALSQFDGIFAADQSVYIKDNQTGTTHDLKSAPYSFTAGMGDFNDRFQIVYRSALSTPKATFNENAVIAFVNNNALNIQTKNVEMKNVSIYDLRGRVLFNSANINAENFTVPNFAAQNQVLMVKVTSTNNEVATVKVIF